MRDANELQEIENLGVGEEAEEEVFEPGDRERGKGSALPLVQALLCALILIALAFLKLTDQENFGKVREWYQKESVREIELPGWADGERQPMASPTPEPARSQPPELEEPSAGELRKV